MSVFKVDEDWVRLTCTRCGADEMVRAMTYSQRIVRGDQDATSCRDCCYRQGQKHNGQVKRSYCNPHKGELDDSLRPLDKYGRLYRPGKRVCGKSDCIKRVHILEGE